MINGINNSVYGQYGGSAPYGINQGVDILGENGNQAANQAEADKSQNETGKASTEECQTCKKRKYQDGSDEMVSYKSAAHISPEAAGAAVRAHDGEHVSNAYNKAFENDGKVVNASVRIFTSVCPECGRTYVSGGVTDTAIKYSNEENPYMKDFKAQQAAVLTGQNIDTKE